MERTVEGSGGRKEENAIDKRGQRLGKTTVKMKEMKKKKGKGKPRRSRRKTVHAASLISPGVGNWPGAVN